MDGIPRHVCSIVQELYSICAVWFEDSPIQKVP